MTSEEYVQAENLMRGKVARQMALTQMIQIDHDSKQQTLVGMAFAIYLSFVINTHLAQAAAITVVLASGCILINGGLLLHRKWNEYVAMEMECEKDAKAGKEPGLWSNIMLEEPENKFAVGLTGALAYALPALLVLLRCSYRLYTT